MMDACCWWTNIIKRGNLELDDTLLYQFLGRLPMVFQDSSSDHAVESVWTKSVYCMKHHGAL